MNGSCKDNPDYPNLELPLEITLSQISGGEKLIRDLFEPLGYTVELQTHPLDPAFPEWGTSPYSTLTLRNTIKLMYALRQLYILIPALDSKKHYWAAEDEVEKLSEKGGDWLQTHPFRDTIINRYLKFKPLQDIAMSAMENNGDKEVGSEPLWVRRRESVIEALQETGAESVIDMGCGNGKYIKRLSEFGQFKRVAGMDISMRELSAASKLIFYGEIYGAKKERFNLFQSSLLHRDCRHNGYDAAIIIEVIEHIDPERLPAFERVVFLYAKPKSVIVTTPNRDYNELLPQTHPVRHRDHKFEWSRAEFKAWTEKICGAFGYSAVIKEIGDSDKELGSQTQMAVFTKVMI
jgi:3' terminal RNA ribose 2'-O-methyltransferase Hen1